MTPPPSIYCYRSEKEWEYEMALWCLENEPRTMYGVKYRDGFITRWEWFDTPETREEWISRHREFTVIETTEQGDCTAPSYNDTKPGCPDKLDGGSRADYRAAGISRY